MSPIARRVALVLGTSRAFKRGILRGIARFVRQRGRWIFDWPQGVPGKDASLETWEGDGVIARVHSEDVAEMVRRTGAPAVDVSGALADSGFPRVLPDERVVGRLAAEHLIDLGIRRLAFVGVPGRGYSDLRGAGFAEAAAEADRPCTFYEPGPGIPPGGRWPEEAADMADWLASLENPVGVLAPGDTRGWQVAEACRRAGLRIPEEVALVGVDNDELVCDLCNPPLSSVAVPWNRIGFEAAELLDGLMGGAAPPGEPIRIPPLRVVARQSSDVLAIDDREVAAALRFIRQHASEPIRVEDVLTEVPVSRRSLERRFRRSAGRTISAEIRRAHLDAAKRLLAETNLSMPEVARASGYRYPQRLSTVFKRGTGLTPTEYRHRFRSR